MISDVKPGERVEFESAFHRGTTTGTLMHMSRFQGQKYARVKVPGRRPETIERNRIIRKTSHRELAVEAIYRRRDW